MHLIDEIDDDAKVDFFAALTRCFLLTSLDEALFFKLCKFILMCTPHELQFLSGIPTTYRSSNNSMISALYQYGLFTQEESFDGVTYVLSDFGKALKQNSLNFDEGLRGENRIVTYERIAPLSIAEPLMFEEIQEAWNNTDVILDGGSATI